jgi:hypothetical protein
MPRTAVRYIEKLIGAKRYIFLRARLPAVIAHNAAHIAKPQEQIRFFKKHYLCPCLFRC